MGTPQDGLTTEADGTKKYFQNGALHRVDGPAVERPDGTREWWQGGKLHREGGPAFERADGRVEYWEKGEPVTHRIGVDEESGNPKVVKVPKTSHFQAK